MPKLKQHKLLSQSEIEVKLIQLNITTAQYTGYCNSLFMLGYTAVQAQHILFGRGSFNSINALLELHEKLIKLIYVNIQGNILPEKWDHDDLAGVASTVGSRKTLKLLADGIPQQLMLLGYSFESIKAIAMKPGATNRFTAMLELTPKLLKIGYSLAAIQTIIAFDKGINALYVVWDLTPGLLEIGYNITVLQTVVALQNGLNALYTLQVMTPELLKIGYDMTTILSIISHNDTMLTLKEVYNHTLELLKFGYDLATIQHMVMDIEGLAKIRALRDCSLALLKSYNNNTIIHLCQYLSSAQIYLFTELCNNATLLPTEASLLARLNMQLISIDVLCGAELNLKAFFIDMFTPQSELGISLRPL